MPRTRSNTTDDAERGTLGAAVALIAPSSVTDLGVTLVVPEVDQSSKAGNQPPTATRRRHKVATSCNRCRQNKRRCDGDLPCANCKRANADCRYTDAQQSRSLWGDTPLSAEKVMGHRRAMQERMASPPSSPQELMNPATLNTDSPSRESSPVRSQASSLSASSFGLGESPQVNPLSSSSRKATRRSVRPRSMPGLQQQQQKPPQTHPRMSYESFDELESVLSPQKPLLDIQLSHCDDCENRHSQDQSSSIHGSMMAFRPTTSNNTTGDECRPDRWSWAPQLFEDAAMDDIDSLLAFDFPSKTFASSGWWAEMNTFLPATESTDHSQAIPTHLHHHQATTDNSDLPATQVPLSDYRQQQPCSPWSDSSYLSPENAPSTYHDSPSPAGPGLILPSPPSPSAIPPLTLLQPIMAPAPTPDPMTFAPMPFQPVESKTLQPSAPIATSSLAPITPVVPVTPVSPVAAAAQVSSATSNLAETAMLSSFLTLAFDSSNPTEAPATSPTPPFLTVAPSATTASTIPSNAKATSNANIQGIQTGKTDVMAGVQPTAASVAALESMLWTHDAEMSEVTSSDWLVSESAHTLEWVVGTLPTPIQELDGRSSATIPGIQSE